MKVATSSKKSGFLAVVFICALIFSAASYSANAQSLTVSIVTDTSVAAPVKHALGKVKSALDNLDITNKEINSLESAEGQIVIVAGTTRQAGSAIELAKAKDISVPKKPESLLVRNLSLKGKKALLVIGADDRGLMYALLDIAESISFSDAPDNPLSEVHNIVESPYVAERALSKYTMHKAHFESYFFDEQYWARYLDMLARNRFNTFALLFGYENQGYFTPPYPYFFDVDGFPEVYVVGLTKDEQKRNLDMLNRLIEMTHERGLNFTLGIWDHIYRDADEPEPPIVWGLTGDNLFSYTKTALGKFLRMVPDIDALQFRMHYESGLKIEEMDQFWGSIYETIKDVRPDIRVDARAKAFPDSLIDKAVEMGIDLRICTKYWAEQMGLPYHPTHIPRENQFDRRHGYADLLRYPQRYKMHWRLWNCGTTRILLWGDPDYVRRFSGSTHLYDGEGFEVVEPLATKMWYHPHDMEPFELLKPKYQYYDYEFERYWHFFQLFGRLGYNPETPPQIWQREFEKRFGKEAAPLVEQAIHRAGKILPRIVAYCFPYEDRFHTTGGWVEKQRREDLPEYADAITSDTQQFLSIDDAAGFSISGIESAKIWPQETSEWFAAVSKDVLQLVAEAEEQIGSNTNKEFFSTMTDLKILANLALYHSRRVHAGLALASFEHTNDLNALDDAIYYETQAIQAWQQIVDAASDVYAEDLKMGWERFQTQGHWKDELAKLREGLKELQAKREIYKPPLAVREPFIAHVPIRRALPAKDLLIKATVSSQEPITNVRVGYRIGQKEYYDHINLEQTGQFTYSGTIDGSELTDTMDYYIEAANQNVGTGWERYQRNTYPSTGPSNPITVIVTDDNLPPALEHKPITSAPVLEPLKITAEVRDPSGIKWVRLRYRSVTQFQDYKTLNMYHTQDKSIYQTEVPAEHIVPKWDFMYFFEIMDNNGNGKIYPDIERQTPYIMVKLQR